MKMQKSVLFVKKHLNFSKYLKDKNIAKLEIIIFIQENKEVLRIAYII